jgi:hypothetical protein
VEKQIEEWELLKTANTQFEVDSSLSSYGDLSAEEYIFSDRLDYDYLS